MAYNHLLVVCGIQFPDQVLNPGPLHLEHGALATGPPGKFQAASSVWKHLCQKPIQPTGKTRKVINCLNLGRPWWFILMQQAVESKRGIGGKEKNKERKFGDCLYKSSLSALMWEREMVFLFSLRCSKHQRQKIDPLSPWLEAYRSRWVGAFFWVLLGSSLTPICHPTCEHRPVGRRRRDWGGLGGSLF